LRQQAAVQVLGADGAAGHVLHLGPFGVNEAKAGGQQARIDAEDTHGLQINSKQLNE
jgi:hypothetical protein